MSAHGCLVHAIGTWSPGGGLHLVVSPVREEDVEQLLGPAGQWTAPEV